MTPYMPVLGAPNGCPRIVPFDMLDEAAARSNHCNQSLDRLKERGGLSVEEILAVINKRRFMLMDENDAVRELKLHLSKYVEGDK